MEPDASVGQLHLTPLLMSPADVSRLKRELMALDEYLRAQALREPGVPMARLPKTSRMLEEFVVANRLNLLQETTRHESMQYLDDMLARAPIIHVSLAADPSSAALQKLVLWLRQNIRGDVLVRVGLQPNVVAGCTIRTTNRYFDFSLRRYLTEHRQYLLEALRPAPKAAAYDPLADIPMPEAPSA